jgi:hypothetical protein
MQPADGGSVCIARQRLNKAPPGYPRGDPGPLWGVDDVAESNVVDRQIRNLRAVLQDDWRQPHFIATAPGRGYRFLLTSSR